MALALGMNDYNVTPTEWLHHREAAAQSRLRLPAVLAAQRIGLGDQRCAELSEQITELRHWLLNRPDNTDPAQVERTQQRISGLEDRLHAERVAVWKDLLPLLSASRDAAIEQLRSSWLAEYGRQLGGGGD